MLRIKSLKKKKISIKGFEMKRIVNSSISCNTKENWNEKFFLCLVLQEKGKQIYIYIYIYFEVELYFNYDYK